MVAQHSIFLVFRRERELHFVVYGIPAGQAPGLLAHRHSLFKIVTKHAGSGKSYGTSLPIMINMGHFQLMSRPHATARLNVLVYSHNPVRARNVPCSLMSLSFPGTR
jgi:hypothetical protein